jgi:hypothetical protein
MTCGSVNHTRKAHEEGSVEPLFCDVCGSFDHLAKQHTACERLVHVDQVAADETR